MSDEVDEFLSHINLEQICEVKEKEEEKRFVDVSSGEIDELSLSNVQSTNTKYKTLTYHSHINVYYLLKIIQKF